MNDTNNGTGQKVEEVGLAGTGEVSSEGVNYGSFITVVQWRPSDEDTEAEDGLGTVYAPTKEREDAFLFISELSKVIDSNEDHFPACIKSITIKRA